jgi:hypothetical protein
MYDEITEQDLAETKDWLISALKWKQSEVKRNRPGVRRAAKVFEDRVRAVESVGDLLQDESQPETV